MLLVLEPAFGFGEADLGTGLLVCIILDCNVDV